ncbi:MAG: LysM peptidoglycan-binding domain-containing protein [Patescibacteria group bacterium]|jgi:LysM repeat protein
MRVKLLSVFLRASIIVGLAILFGLQQTPSVLGLVGGVSMTPVDGSDGKGRGVFNLIVEPGKPIKDAFYVQNASSETLKIAIFPSGYELNPQGVITEVQELPDMMPEPGKWIQVDKSEVVLTPNTKVKIGFTINVPATADVGDHMGTLFVQSLPKSTGTKGSGVSINIRNGVRVYMTVPGEIDRNLLVHKVRHKIYPFWQIFNRKLAFVLDLENKGNVTLTPKIDITMQGLFGQVGKQEGVQYARLFRNQRQTAEKDWIKRAPYFGRFVVNFAMHLGERKQINLDLTETILPDKIINARYVFWVFPWQELIGLIFIGFILYLIRSIWLYFVIANRLKTNAKLYVVARGDTLTKIAGNFGLDARTLASFNLIRWPYNIEAGDKLLIPTGRATHFEWRSRLRQMLFDRATWRHLFGHLFNRHAYRRLTERANAGLTGRVGGVLPTSRRIDEVLIVERGDTIQDVAKFASVSVSTIAKYNRLKSPYRLRVGQELLAPKKVKPNPTTIKRKRK